MTPGRRAQKRRYIQRKLQEEGMNGVKLRRIRGRNRNNHKRKVKDACESKQKYRNWGHANNVAHHAFEERGVSLKIYQCELCNEYHLTSNLIYADMQASKLPC